MKKISNVITKNRLLAWLMKATLVLGIIAFSGHITAGSYQPEPVKTELKQADRGSSKNTVSFKKSVTGASFLEFISKPASFTSNLVQYGNTIKVKLKHNLTEITTAVNQDKNFLKHYRFHYSAESETDEPKG